MRTGLLFPPPPDAYRAIEDRAVDLALRIQEEASVDVVTGDKMRRDVFADFDRRPHRRLDALWDQRLRFHTRNDTGFEISFSVTERVTALSCLAIDDFHSAAARAGKPGEPAGPTEQRRT